MNLLGSSTLLMIVVVFCSEWGYEKTMGNKQKGKNA
jgi:hypothetical protein